MSLHPQKVSHISECSIGEIRLLTKILQFLPNTTDVVGHINSIFKAIDTLPARLKRPNAFVRAFKPYAKPRADFCKLHKGLSPKIIHSLFSLIALEVGAHLNVLANNGHMLTEEQANRGQRLRQMHCIWLDPQVYGETFGESPFTNKWRYQANQCEACSITRIASDFEAVADLRCAILSRMTRKHIKRTGEPRLKPWFDYFFQAWNSEGLRFEALVERNRTDGLQLKDARKQAYFETHKRKRAKRPAAGAANLADNSGSSTLIEDSTRRISDWVENVEDGEDEEAIDADYDAELDIIDHYAALKSTMSLATKRALPDDRSTIRNPSRPASSIYSLNTRKNNERVISGEHTRFPQQEVSDDIDDDGEYIPIRKNWFARKSSQVLPDSDLQRTRSAAKQAQSYQDLLSPQPLRTGRSAVSLWEDMPLTSHTVYSTVNVDRPAEEVFNPQPPTSHHGDEWTPLPGAFQDEMRTPHTSTNPSSSTNQHTKSDSLATRRGRSPSTISTSPPSVSSRPLSWISTASSKYSRDKAESDASSISAIPPSRQASHRKPQPQPQSSQYRDRSRPQTAINTARTAETRWSGFYDKQGPERVKRAGENIGRASSVYSKSGGDLRNTRMFLGP